MTRPPSTRATLALACCCALASSLLAEPPGAPPKQSAPAQPADALRGPAVDDRTAPLGPGASLSGDAAPMREGEPRVVPHRVFIQAVLGLGSQERHNAEAALRRAPLTDQPATQDATPSLALTEAQINAIRAIAKEHQAKVAAYMEAHSAELSESDDPPGASPTTTEQRRTRAEEVRRNAPSPANAQAMIFAILTEAQREAVNARLEELRNQAIEQRAKEQVRERADNPPRRGAARDAQQKQPDKRRPAGASKP